MELSKKLIYTKPSKEKSESKVFNMHNPEEIAAAIKYAEETEKQRIANDKEFIALMTEHFYSHEEMIIEEMKTKSDATRLRELIKSRIFILEEEYNDIDDELSDLRSFAIRKGKYLLDLIDRKFEYLPDKLYSNPESLSFSASDELINGVIELTSKLDFFENHEPEMIKYALFNKPINKQFVPIRIKRGKGDALIYLIYKLAGKIDEKGFAINHELGEIRRNAHTLFGMKNKEGRMQTLKQSYNGKEIDELFKKYAPSVK